MSDQLNRHATGEALTEQKTASHPSNRGPSFDNSHSHVSGPIGAPSAQPPLGQPGQTAGPTVPSPVRQLAAEAQNAEDVVEVEVKAPLEPPIPVRTSQDGTSLADETKGNTVTRISGDGVVTKEAAKLPIDTASPSASQHEKIGSTPSQATTNEMEKTEASQRKAGEVPTTEVEGIEDTDLWALQRRFDENITHVLFTPLDIDPDLRPSTESSPFRSDVLKSNFERVAAAIGPPSLRGVRELRRIADWEGERTRTAVYCVVYFVAWSLGCTVLLLGTFLAVVVCFPHTRRYLFPEVTSPAARPSATDPSNVKGDESLLDTPDNSHRTRAEQAEQQAFEARAITEAYAQVILLGGKGKRTGAKRNEKGSDAIVDDTGNVVGWRGNAADGQTGSGDVTVAGEPVQAKAGHSTKKVEKLAAKQKRDEMVNNMAKQTQLFLGTVADYLEIIQHAMSPPGPYPDHYARFKIASALIIPPALAIHFVPAWLWGRVVTFSLGAALWGYPIARRFIAWIGPKFDWAYILDPRNSILAKTPTNAQLVLHILRVCESVGEPLPPPPEPPVEGEVKEALQEQSPITGPGANAPKIKEDDNSAEKVAKKVTAKSKHHVANAFKKISRKLAGARGDVAIDGKPKPLSKISNMLVERKFGEHSPDAYACKLDGTVGNLLVDAEGGRIGFVGAAASDIDPARLWSIDDIVELRKDGISLPRMALSWLGGVDVESLGLDIHLAGLTEPLHLQSVRRRDPLFNRLIAIGPQRWETL